MDHWGSCSTSVRASLTCFKHLTPVHNFAASSLLPLSSWRIDQLESSGNRTVCVCEPLAVDRCSTSAWQTFFYLNRCSASVDEARWSGKSNPLFHAWIWMLARRLMLLRKSAMLQVAVLSDLEVVLHPLLWKGCLREWCEVLEFTRHVITVRHHFQNSYMMEQYKSHQYVHFTKLHSSISLCNSWCFRNLMMKSEEEVITLSSLKNPETAVFSVLSTPIM